MINTSRVNPISKFYSIILTIAIISVLVFAVPAQALDVKLSPASSPKIVQGADVSFTAGLNIKTGEQVPLSTMSIQVGSQVCTFNVDGSPITGCENIQIELLKFESDYLNADGTFKFKGNKYQYGYGYGYQEATGSAEIEYNIVIDTVEMQKGKYSVVLKAQTETDSFASVTHKFEVK